MPVYRRPERTARAIKCLKAQTMEDFEAIVIGDGCPDFDQVVKLIANDSRFRWFNTTLNWGGCGYSQTNWAIQNARAPYFCFFANDDLVLPDHLRTYLGAIEGTDLDWAYMDYMAFGKRMKTRIRYARIGHSALVVKTAYLQQMPPHSSQYGHDYDLITNLVKGGGKFKKVKIEPTYYVVSGNKHREDPWGLD